MKLQLPEISQIETLTDFKRFVSIITSSIQSVINGNLSLGDNMSLQFITVEFNASGTQVVSSHGLKRVPAGYIAVGMSAPCIVYDGSTTNTTDQIYLKANAASIVRLLIY